MNSKSLAHALRAKVCDAVTRFDGREGIIGYGNVIEGSRAVECALSSIGFSDYPDLHMDHGALGRWDTGYSDPRALCGVANVERNE